ncbi:hypothetical protein ACJIZ3_008036 [Penstemon smallii]|uniref:Uncharacterized protein n=1 Tax=Penstemon smallii TaxID=265156 RepID=A0ABD3T8L7_9LAMI
MSSSTTKGTKTHDHGTAQNPHEKRVETVDIRSTAGQGQKQKPHPVQIVHSPEAAASNTSGSVLTNAAASVASTLQSAKEAISGK